MGHLPWTPIGIGFALLGGTAAVVFGANHRMAAAGARSPGPSALPATLAIAFWWATSALQASSGACCGPVSYDPFTAAYSSPQGMFLLVVLPALVMAAGVLTPQHSEPRFAHQQ